jgi:hypothetical protein
MANSVLLSPTFNGKFCSFYILFETSKGVVASFAICSDKHISEEAQASKGVFLKKNCTS